MRHQPFFFAERDHQIGIGFDLIDGREPQARKLRHVLQNLPHELTERRRLPADRVRRR